MVDGRLAARLSALREQELAVCGEFLGAISD